MANPLIPSDPDPRTRIPTREERPTRDPEPDKPSRPRPQDQDGAHSRGDGSSEHPT